MNHWGHSKRRSGFTIVELIVSMGILVMLAGITITAYSAGLRRMQAQETASTLRQLEAASEAWMGATERRLRRADDASADLDPETEYVYVIGEVLAALERSADARKCLATIAPRRTHRYVPRDLDLPPIWIRTYSEEERLPDQIGRLVVFDAWGTPIYATHPGELAGPDATDVDPDGTERTPNEAEFGSARGRQVCFVSAGPDRRFGVWTEFPGMPGPERRRAMAEARRDNLYSHPPVNGTPE
ncbi:MAG: type II secretion system protein [Phycisphaerales bacterium]